MHAPPPRMRVASCHCRTYFRHLPTPSGVMLKEHMGSPAMVSAPSCSTTASGLNAAYTSFSTLWREEAVGVTANTAQRDAGGKALVPQIHQCLSRFLCSLFPPPSYQLRSLCSSPAVSLALKGLITRLIKVKASQNPGEGDLVLISLVVASNHVSTGRPEQKAASQIQGLFSPVKVTVKSRVWQNNNPKFSDTSHQDRTG